jgi:hypothetical protein
MTDLSITNDGIDYFALSLSMFFSQLPYFLPPIPSFFAFYSTFLSSFLG